MLLIFLKNTFYLRAVICFVQCALVLIFEKRVLAVVYDKYVLYGKEPTQRISHSTPIALPAPV